jgi:hypothetical protein
VLARRLAPDEERRLDTVPSKQFKDPARPVGVGAIVERQRDLHIRARIVVPGPSSNAPSGLAMALTGDLPRRMLAD